MAPLLVDARAHYQAHHVRDATSPLGYRPHRCQAI